MGSVLGINPWESAYDVWLKKTGKIKEEELKSQPVEAGNRFERGVLAWASQNLGPLRRNVYVVAGRNLPIHAILDARVVKSGNPVEAKTAGLFGPLSDQWGEEGSDEVPDIHHIQVQTQLLCTQKELGHLAAFLAGRGFQMFDIPANKDLQDIIQTRAVEFWEKNVLADIPPADSLPSLELSKMIRRVPSKLVEIPNELFLTYTKAKQALKEAKENEETAKKMIMAALDDAEGSFPGVWGQITYMLQGTPGSQFDTDRLKRELPDVWEAFQKPPSPIRVLRVKKPRL